MTEVDILGLSGSLRAGSMNTALLRAAQKHSPAGVSVTINENLGDVPLYNGDLDTENPPAAVRELREAITRADGLLIATPEYNYSVPGVLKNALDWASRPAASSSLTHKPIAIMGAAPGNFGTVRAQLALRQSFVWTRSRVLTRPEVMVFNCAERFDQAGNLTDEKTIELIRELLTALREQVRG
ncbi:NADPH-dependent FMN reductase [Nonomuraea lactucae]|uniref:NADPH-dependent FMN reductase n=1 Tax=Nonomuraea lactucae TaxID=2249762 RepID=UPI000DE3F22C|nr:NADPH-dependent FMN reductase [Nonomuraea lactucae]